MGACPAWLSEMRRVNGGVELAPPNAAIHRVAIVGRMHAWEWLAGARKADAYDHCAAHDLVGCQDIAWDIAGAEHELGLPADRLAAIVGDVDPRHVAFLRPCYLAFQLGRHALAVDTDAGEAPRLRAAADRYARALRVAVAALRR